MFDLSPLDMMSTRNGGGLRTFMSVVARVLPWLLTLM